MATAADPFHGINIGQILQSKGPTVKAVLLRHMNPSGRDVKPHPPPVVAHPVAASTSKMLKEETETENDSVVPTTTLQVEHHHHRVVLTELIEEIQVDTTPSKKHVEQILGGPWTFLGQYPDEGTMLMIRKQPEGDSKNAEDEAPSLPDKEELQSLSIKELRTMCEDHSIDTTDCVEKSDLVEALTNHDTTTASAPQNHDEEVDLPINPHRLQPPFDGVAVRGDILMLRVAETPEELDQEDKNTATAEGKPSPAAASQDDQGTKNEEAAAAGADAVAKRPELHVMSNDEFFLDYTKEEYCKFASRTDVVAPEPPAIEDDEDDDGDDDDDDDEEEYDPEDDDNLMEELEEGSEEEKRALLNLIMGNVLKTFRVSNGRGPDSRELLELRSQVAQKLGVEVASFQEDNETDDPQSPKKRAWEGDESSPSKKVKFSGPIASEEDDNGRSPEGEAAEEKKTSDDGEVQGEAKTE